MLVKLKYVNFPWIRQRGH